MLNYDLFVYHHAKNDGKNNKHELLSVILSHMNDLFPICILKKIKIWVKEKTKAKNKLK